MKRICLILFFCTLYACGSGDESTATNGSSDENPNDNTSQPTPVPTETPTPSPTPDAQEVPPLSGFEIVAVVGDSLQYFNSLNNGDTVDLATLPDRINISAVSTNAAGTGSVAFELVGPENISLIDNNAAYTLQSQSVGFDVTAKHPSVGDYTLRATPYSEPDGQGSAGTNLSINFTVVDSSQDADTAQVPSITGINLVRVDASDNLLQDHAIQSGETIDLDNFVGNVIDFFAVSSDPDATGSVMLSINTSTPISLVDYSAPYLLGGNNHFDVDAGALAAGTYTLTATPYSEANGNGNAGETYSVSFTIDPVAGADSQSSSPATLEITGTRYYIDPDGVDLTEGGTESAPWRTLSYACNMVTMAGDAIHVNPGTYIMTEQCHLSEGVSIEGEGDTSLIVSHLTDAWGPSIWLTSPTVGTDGAQHIFNIRMDGNGATAWAGIYVAARSNVLIHEATFTNFLHSAAIFNGKVAMGDNAEPTQWATGNQFYNNTVTNCSGWHIADGYASGSLAVGSQDGMQIFNNTFTQTSRTEGENGYLIKYFSNGYNRNLKIHNNTLEKAAPINRGNDWNFAIELWNSRGGIEIYDNTIFGAIDIAGASGGPNFNYAWSVHDNTIGYTSFQSYNASASNGGIYVEGEHTGGGYAYRNLFRFIGTPLQFYPHGNHTVQDLFFYNNIFNGIGINSSGGWNNLSAWATAQVLDQLPTIDNFHFVHNVVYANGGDASRGLQLPDVGNATNIDVSNNIFLGFNYQPVYSNLAGARTIDSLSIRNNIFYDNGVNAQAFDGTAPTTTVINGNIVNAPDFVVAGSDFHLRAGSWGVDDGVSLDWITDDFERVPVGNPPNIGSYETVD